MNTPPNLNDPIQREAYRRELQGVVRPMRYTGVAFCFLGAALAVARQEWLPQIPSIVPMLVIGAGALNILGGIVVGARYHRKRMRAD